MNLLYIYISGFLFVYIGLKIQFTLIEPKQIYYNDWGNILRRLIASSLSWVFVILDTLDLETYLFKAYYKLLKIILNKINSLLLIIL